MDLSSIVRPPPGERALIDLADALHAAQRHSNVEFFLQYLDRARDARLTGCAQPVGAGELPVGYTPLELNR